MLWVCLYSVYLSSHRHTLAHTCSQCAHVFCSLSPSVFPLISAIINCHGGKWWRYTLFSSHTFVYLHTSPCSNYIFANCRTTTIASDNDNDRSALNLLSQRYFYYYLSRFDINVYVFRTVFRSPFAI